MRVNREANHVSFVTSAPGVLREVQPVSAQPLGSRDPLLYKYQKFIGKTYQASTSNLSSRTCLPVRSLAKAGFGIQKLLEVHPTPQQS